MQEVAAVRITVNGEERELPESTTVQSLLVALDIRAKAIAVERNREIVPRAHHAECTLRDGDQLEIVTLVGGG